MCALTPTTHDASTQRPFGLRSGSPLPPPPPLPEPRHFIQPIRWIRWRGPPQVQGLLRQPGRPGHLGRPHGPMQWRLEGCPVRPGPRVGPPARGNGAAWRDRRRNPSATSRSEEPELQEQRFRGRVAQPHAPRIAQDGVFVEQQILR